MIFDYYLIQKFKKQIQLEVVILVVKLDILGTKKKKVV
jgi:hypothetical protein